MHINGPMMVFAGNSNLPLAQAIASHLKARLGHAVVDRFSDDEIMVEINEHVRGKDVFVVQSTCRPANDNLMELLAIVDALRRSSAARVTAVIPYFGYARQDRRPRSQRVPISAKLVADMLQAAGYDRIITVDVHADQIQGFFNIPVDNVYASPILLGDIWRQLYPRKVVVSPDVGGVVRARAVAKRLDDAELAIIDKRRPRPNESSIMHIIGDVEDKTCIIVDDIVDTAGTLCQAANALKDRGARKVVAYITHPVLSGDAVSKIAASGLDELVVSDSIPLSEQGAACPNIRQLSIAEILAETMRRVSNDESVSELFVE